MALEKEVVALARTQDARLARVRSLDPLALRRRYDEGASTVDLVCEFGISRTTVRALLVKAGTQMRTSAEARSAREANAWLRLPRPQDVAPGTTLKDIDGVVFRLVSMTPTSYDFAILRGRPFGKGGPSSIILTAELALHLHRHRLTPGQLNLPISDRMVLMLRRRMSFNSWNEKKAWWEAHREELASSDVEKQRAMAAERGIDPATVACLRLRLCGRRRMPQSSWLDEKAKALLLSDRPRAELAAIFDLTPIYISYLRKKLRATLPGVTQPTASV